MATCGYIINMVESAIGIRELKNDLSSYIKDVERGGIVLVTNRNKVVAEIWPAGSNRESTENFDLKNQFIESGFLHPPKSNKRIMPKPITSACELVENSSVDLLDWVRGE